MKIGINALFYQHPASGTGQYMFHLLDALSTIDSQNEYVLFGPQPASNTTSFYPYVVQPVPAFVQRNENLRKIFWEQVTAPTAARKARGRCDACSLFRTAAPATRAYGCHHS